MTDAFAAATTSTAAGGAPTTATAAHDVDGVLLRRLGLVYAEGSLSEEPLRNDGGIHALEADLARRALVLTAELRTALRALAAADLALVGIRTLGRVDAWLGADRRYTPLFAGFPASVPGYAHARYSAQIRAFLVHQTHQPCVVCGTAGEVGALAPCAHLVCPDCHKTCSGQCPVCGTALPEPERYLRPVADGQAGPVWQTVFRTLRLGRDRASDVLGLTRELLARRTALAPADRDDLTVLLRHVCAGAAADADADGLLRGLTSEIPLRESKATVLALALDSPTTHASARALLPEVLGTATDVLRLMWAYSGAHPDLLTPPRLRTLPRPLRRDLLAVLNGLAFPLLAEDLGRHRQAWLRAAETLHPYEHAGHYPYAALAFAVLRGTDLSGPLGERLMPHVTGLPLEVRRLPGGAVRVRLRTFASLVETALARGDVHGAIGVLAARPGELVRRLHHVLRVHAAQGASEPPAALAPALARALPLVAPGPLLGAWGRLRGHRELGERRVWFPRGELARAYGHDDFAPPVPASLADPVAALLEAEVTARGERLPSVDVAILDAGTADLVAPFAERATPRALVAVPRGSGIAIPDGRRTRLFLHWVQPHGTRVDLDLSVALFDADWNRTGQCDYTELVHGDRAAVHSGDFTEAPAPAGATEFVDLDLDRLVSTGARYAVVVVFSYNDVPFDELEDAFAGFIDLGTAEAAVEDGEGNLYDPKAVVQRFDLAGPGRARVSMAIDLMTRRAQWLDTDLATGGGRHSVDAHSGDLGSLVRDLRIAFTPGSRATIGDLARRTAAARSREVVVRATDGDAVDLRTFRRTDDETIAAFADRIATGTPDTVRHCPAATAAALLAEDVRGRTVYACLVHGDIALPATAGEVYRLYPGAADAAPDTVTRLAAQDLVAHLAPRTS
ncbi:MAG: hypothetical protein HOV66_06685 [Streptomycetaceae bacterium]|nr:hypothetical protein [Streptomycetaceae bacterium]